MRSTKDQPNLLSILAFRIPEQVLAALLMDTLVCMPLPCAPTTGLGKNRGVTAHAGGNLAADQFV